MKKLNRKKGFTIVELVIVIAVVGVLTAVLVPTFVNLANQAKRAENQTFVRNLNTQMGIREATEGKNKTMYEAMMEAEDIGYNVEKLTPVDGNDVVWDSVANRFAIVDKDGKEVYSDGGIKGTGSQLWKIYAEMPKTQTYSIYAKEGWKVSEVENLTVGFDAGKNAGIATVSYIGTSSVPSIRESIEGRTPKMASSQSQSSQGQEAVIRTNSFDTTLTVNAPNDTVKHYGKAYTINVNKIALSSYHEYGNVLGNINLQMGRVVAEKGCIANAIVIDKTYAELTTAVDISATNKDAPNVPIMLKTSEESWRAYANNAIFDPLINNIIYEKITVADPNDPTQFIEVNGAASVDEKVYATFNEAWEAAKNNQTVRLLDDVTLSGMIKGVSATRQVLTDKVLTLDLNGHILKMGANYLGFTVLESGDLTIKDSSKTDTSGLYTTDYAYYVSGGKLTFENIYLEGTGTVSTGQINSGIFTINGGKYVSPSYSVYCQGGTFNAYGGLFEGVVGTNGSQSHNVVMNIYGGTYHRMLYKPCDGVLNIYGGYFEAETCVYAKSGITNITGGTFHAIGARNPFSHNDSGANPTGAAIVIESCSYPGGDPKTQIIENANITSDNSVPIECYVYYTEGTQTSEIPYISMDCDYSYTLYRVVKSTTSNEYTVTSEVVNN